MSLLSGQRIMSRRPMDRLSPTDLRDARTFCLRLTRDQHLAEDVFQEGCLRVLERARPDLGPGEVRPYLFRTLANLSINCLARRHRRDVGLRDQEFVDDSAEPASRNLEAEDIRERVSMALERLPERQRRAVILRERDGLEYVAVAEALDVSIGNAAALVHRGLVKLRSLLKDLLSDEEAP